MNIEELIGHKKLAWYDFGAISIVKPTGRYLDVLQDMKPDFYEERNRFSVEVKTSWFSKKWVTACNLKVIKEKQ